MWQRNAKLKKKKNVVEECKSKKKKNDVKECKTKKKEKRGRGMQY